MFDNGLLPTALKQFRDRPLALFNPGFHRRGATNRQVHFAEIVIRKVERDRRLEVLELLAESVGQPRQPAAVHPQRVVLLLNVRG